MSIAVDCPSCAMGNHDRHDREWGLKPDVIGGQHCACAGDCVERFKAEMENVCDLLPPLPDP